MKNRRLTDRPHKYKRLEHANTQELLEKVTNNLKEAPLGRSLSMDRKLRSYRSDDNIDISNPENSDI